MVVKTRVFNIIGAMFKLRVIIKARVSTVPDHPTESLGTNTHFVGRLIDRIVERAVDWVIGWVVGQVSMIESSVKPGHWMNLLLLTDSLSQTQYTTHFLVEFMVGSIVRSIVLWR